MHNARAAFLANIRTARDQTNLYDFLSGSVSSPFPYDDLLRSQIVYSVSAFDKLIHDLIKVGMVASFIGSRPKTPSYLAETITIEIHSAITSAAVPPPETVFEQEIVRKLGFQSFQDPDKIAKGLSLIWNETQKWSAIAGSMGLDVYHTRTTMKLISTRRNSIVHEADIDPVTNSKTPISRSEANDATNFIESCGSAIVNLVI